MGALGTRRLSGDRPLAPDAILRFSQEVRRSRQDLVRNAVWCRRAGTSRPQSQDGGSFGMVLAVLLKGGCVAPLIGFVAPHMSTSANGVITCGAHRVGGNRKGDR